MVIPCFPLLCLLTEILRKHSPSPLFSHLVIKLFILLWIHIDLILVYRLKSNTIIIYFVPQIVRLWPLGAP